MGKDKSTSGGNNMNKKLMKSKPCIYETTIEHCESANSGTATCNQTSSSEARSRTSVYTKAEDLSHRRAIALAMVTTTTTQAAVATAQAAVEVMRLASPSKIARKYYNAAVVIQTAFRGYLSREGSSVTDEWDGHQHTLEEIKAMLQKTKQASSENALSTAFSRQVKKRLSFPSPKADACGAMSDTESERSLRRPSSTHGMQFVTGRRSSTLLRRQPW
ncbi:hypothetical protein TSUD_336420 [Trifolium subterraneum]|uniref:DUF4005 domain-containing protein n=1 Tax=Trifolium subterraneum TaxID=3900 RepID=A0A2Z6MT51_TRISU|nr:hypothetical protein TSUD_336420 [Trifolium subterraneum]